MQLRNYVLGVFIVLSTIVTFTDCCSSRVFLLKEHALKSIDEIPMTSPTTPHSSSLDRDDTNDDDNTDDFIFQPQLDKYLQHIKDFINSIAMNPNKTQYHNGLRRNISNEDIINQDDATAIMRVKDDPGATYLNLNNNNNNNIDLNNPSHPYHHYWQQQTHQQQQQQQQRNKQQKFSHNTKNYDRNGNPGHNHDTGNNQPEHNDNNKDDNIAGKDALSTMSSNQYVQRPVSVIRESNVDNINLHFDDVYYTIMKDVLSFACTGQFLTDFCLNKGRCFRYPVGNQSFFSCECADGYVGERCESKSVQGDYEAPLASALVQPRILTARVVFSFPMLLAITVVYLCCSAIVVFKCHPIQMHKRRRPSIFSIASTATNPHSIPLEP